MQLKPGRELDAQIAERVMGIQVGLYQKTAARGDMEYRCTYGGQSDVFELPCYSTEISAAWQIVEKMYRLDYGYCIERAQDTDRATVHFIPRQPRCGFINFIEDMEQIANSASSLPHAICLAALDTLKTGETS